jgi:hypothetical protein
VAARTKRKYGREPANAPFEFLRLDVDCTEFHGTSAWQDAKLSEQLAKSLPNLR